MSKIAIHSVILSVGLTTAFASSGRCQQWVEQPDQVGTQIVQVGRAHVTLPAGEWTQEAVETVTDWERRVYFQVEGGRITAVANIESNLVAKYVQGKWADYGWRYSPTCLRRDVVFYNNVSIEPPTMDCMFVNHNTMNGRNFFDESQAWHDAKRIAFLQHGGFRGPMIYTETNLRAANRSEWIVVSVFVSPGRWGFEPEATNTWADSAWHKDNIDQKHQAFINLFSRWALAYRVRLRQSWE